MGADIATDVPVVQPESMASNLFEYKFDPSILRHNTAINLIEKADQYTVEELRAFETEYRSCECRHLSLTCLLILSRRTQFDDSLIDSLRVIVQSEIKQPRDAHHEFKDDFSKRCDSDNPIVKSLMESLHDEIRLNFMCVALPIIEICNNLLKNADQLKDDATRHLISKMRADVSRYLYEVLQEPIYREYAIAANKKSWEEISKTDPHYTDAHYLGVLLNYSVYLYNVEENIDEAIAFATNHFEQAKLVFPNFSEKQPKEDGARIVKLLEENIKAWTLEKNETASPAE